MNLPARRSRILQRLVWLAPFAVAGTAFADSTVASGPLVHVPSPFAFWLLVCFVIVPAVALIWASLRRHETSSRAARRRIRQLEIQLARQVAAFPEKNPSAPAPLKTRPSTLTSRIPAPDQTAPLAVTAAIRFSGIT